VTASSVNMTFGPGARVLAPYRHGEQRLVRWAAGTVVSADGEYRKVRLDWRQFEPPPDDDPDEEVEEVDPAEVWDTLARIDELYPMGPEPMWVSQPGSKSLCLLLILAGRHLGLSGGQLIEITGLARERGICDVRARVVRALKDGVTDAGSVTWDQIALAISRDRESVRSLYARSTQTTAEAV